MRVEVAGGHRAALRTQRAPSYQSRRELPGLDPLPGLVLNSLHGNYVNLRRCLKAQLLPPPQFILNLSLDLIDGADGLALLHVFGTEVHFQRIRQLRFDVDCEFLAARARIHYEGVPAETSLHGRLVIERRFMRGL